MTDAPLLQQLSDEALLVEVARLAGSERAATVRLVAALAEVDARRLYVGQGCASLFVFCTRVLRLSEHAAYGRIEAARASRRFPVLLEMLERGDLTLTAIGLLGPHLSEANHQDVLARARHRSKREVEEIVASLRPRRDVPSTIRKLPDRTASSPVDTSPDTPFTPASAVTPSASAAPPAAARAVVQPLAPERYKLQLTISRATQEKLRRAQDLMRHAVPSGDLAAILDRALDLLLADLERKKIAASSRPRAARAPAPGSRHIPAAVRRRVWERDGGRCAFRGAHGALCGETAFLEFHHVVPYAVGGAATVDSVSLRCRRHNAYEADLFFGDPFLARERPWPSDRYSVRTEFVWSGRAKPRRLRDTGDESTRRPPADRCLTGAALRARRVHDIRTLTIGFPPKGNPRLARRVEPRGNPFGRAAIPAAVDRYSGSPDLAHDTTSG